MYGLLLRRIYILETGLPRKFYKGFCLQAARDPQPSLAAGTWLVRCRRSGQKTFSHDAETDSTQPDTGEHQLRICVSRR